MRRNFSSAPLVPTSLQKGAAKFGPLAACVGVGARSASAPSGEMHSRSKLPASDIADVSDLRQQLNDLSKNVKTDLQSRVTFGDFDQLEQEVKSRASAADLIRLRDILDNNVARIEENIGELNRKNGIEMSEDSLADRMEQLELTRAAETKQAISSNKRMVQKIDKVEASMKGLAQSIERQKTERLDVLRRMRSLAGQVGTLELKASTAFAVQDGGSVSSTSKADCPAEQHAVTKPSSDMTRAMVRPRMDELKNDSSELPVCTRIDLSEEVQRLRSMVECMRNAMPASVKETMAIITSHEDEQRQQQLEIDESGRRARDAYGHGEGLQAKQSPADTVASAVVMHELQIDALRRELRAQLMPAIAHGVQDLREEVHGLLHGFERDVQSLRENCSDQMQRFEKLRRSSSLEKSKHSVGENGGIADVVGVSIAESSTSDVRPNAEVKMRRSRSRENAGLSSSPTAPSRFGDFLQNSKGDLQDVRSLRSGSSSRTGSSHGLGGCHGFGGGVRPASAAAVTSHSNSKSITRESSKFSGAVTIADALSQRPQSGSCVGRQGRL